LYKYNNITYSVTLFNNLYTITICVLEYNIWFYYCTLGSWILHFFATSSNKSTFEL